MGLDVDVLRSSFEAAVSRQPRLVGRFYEILFERYPQARPLFGRNSQDKQEQMLTEALVAVLAHLEDASWLQTQLAALGHKHKDYGVTREMYDWVGECLVAALSEAAGDRWTSRETEAWVGAYGAIVGLMTADQPGS